MPNWNTISISGYHIREAGANAIQELAFTFSNAIEYTNAAIQKGLDVNKFSKRMSFFFNSHNYFFEEIAKFRAARKIWANIMKTRFNVLSKKGQMCRFHTQTAGSTLQAQQIDNNIVRTTLQATAAIIGGTQSLHTNSKDEALSLPSKNAAQTALRTQQIIAYESGIPDVVDPLAGSYYIEHLTDTIVCEVEKLIKKIDDLGGSIKAIEKNFQENEIANTAYEYQNNIETNKQTIVGINKYFDEKKNQSNIAIENNLESTKEQIKRLTVFKKNRNQKNVQSSLNKLNHSLNTNQNLFPSILQCVKNNCTLGEICDIMRIKYGEHM